MPTALLSVFRKEGIVEFARDLQELGFDFVSSTGTAKTLQEAKLPVTDVAELSGFPAILDHQVVTLVPHVHGGILARDLPRHHADLARIKARWIHLVCVDLYPIEEAIRKPGATLESVREMTDIGGRTLLCSAAKGGRIVIADPDDRGWVIQWLKDGEPNREEVLRELAAKAEATVARYALASARFLSEGEWDGVIGRRVCACRYGENAWQKPAGLYTADTGAPLALDQFELVGGGEPSYNNWCDVDRLLQTVTHIAAGWDVNFGEVPAIAVGVKHGNACGAAVMGSPEGSLRYMVAGDPLALFGGLVMTNFRINGELARILVEHLMPQGKRVLDGVLAPEFTEEAIEELSRKSGKCRLLMNPALAHLSATSLDAAPRFRYVRGGFLRQPNYTYVLDLADLGLTSLDRAVFGGNLLLGWAVGATSNSNTITLVRNNMIIANAVGQQDRVRCAKIAVFRAREAGHDTRGAVAYSDSFFPFTDGPQALADAGVRTILASSGSIRDEEVKTFCKERGVALYLVPDAKARGFFGH